jgi:hypothetical protein
MTYQLRNDERSYIRIQPLDERSRLEVALYGVTVYRDILLPVSLERLLAAPLEHLVELTPRAVDWELIFHTGYTDTVVERMIQVIRERLPKLLDEEDGAFDHAGRPVLIATGEPSQGGMNCSGFAKWVVDGLYAPLRGEYMSIDKLKTRDLERRGTRWSAVLESERDPYFGLDWSRNMAVLLQEARSGRPVSDSEFADIRRVPFLEYREDVGYPIEELELLMYLLAQRNPGRFFLGSVNREFGQDPTLHQHTHVVTLFPTYTPSGQFRVVVMERNLETGLESLLRRYPDTHIHLVGIDASAGFEPLTLRPGD